MKSWFTSLDGAIRLSFAAFLIELFRGFIDFAFLYSADFKGSEILMAFIYVVVFGIWGTGLVAAREGKGWGLIAAFVIGLLFWIGQDWMTMLVFCPNGCNTNWAQIASLVDLIVGGLALSALGLQLWRKRERVAA